MRLAAILLLLLAGCGARAGDACSQAGAASCEGADAALICEGGKLRAVPCKGDSGCSSGTGKVICDLSGNRAGDPCPSAQEGKAQCDASDVHQMLTCTQGAFAAQSCPSRCVVSAGQVGCE